MNGLEPDQTVAEPSRCSLPELLRLPGSELLDLVLELRNQRVRPAGKTDGSDVVGLRRRLRLAAEVWVRKRESAAEDGGDHN